MGSSSPNFGVKIKNIWNHHLVIHLIERDFNIEEDGELNFNQGPIPIRKQLITRKQTHII